MACFEIPSSDPQRRGEQPASRACVYTHTLLSLAGVRWQVRFFVRVWEVDNVYCLKTIYVIKSPSKGEHTPFLPVFSRADAIKSFLWAVVPLTERTCLKWGVLEFRVPTPPKASPSVPFSERLMMYSIVDTIHYQKSNRGRA